MTTKKPANGATEPSAPAKPASDVALIHGVTPDGAGLQIIRAREDRIEIGALRPLVEGAHITGEVVKLRPRENCPQVCDVDVLFKAPELPSDRQVPQARALPAHSGPAQVASDEYRRNWDAIWSRAPERTKLAN